MWSYHPPLIWVKSQSTKQRAGRQISPLAAALDLSRKYGGNITSLWIVISVLYVLMFFFWLPGSRKQWLWGGGGLQQDLGGPGQETQHGDVQHLWRELRQYQTDKTKAKYLQCLQPAGWRQSPSQHIQSSKWPLIRLHELLFEPQKTCLCRPLHFHSIHRLPGCYTPVLPGQQNGK